MLDNISLKPTYRVINEMWDLFQDLFEKVYIIYIYIYIYVCYITYMCVCVLYNIYITYFFSSWSQNTILNSFA
jgi:hypothetical protein